MYNPPRVILDNERVIVFVYMRHGSTLSWSETLIPLFSYRGSLDHTNYYYLFYKLFLKFYYSMKLRLSKLYQGFNLRITLAKVNSYNLPNGFKTYTTAVSDCPLKEITFIEFLGGRFIATIILSGIPQIPTFLKSDRRCS